MPHLLIRLCMGAVLLSVVSTACDASDSPSPTPADSAVPANEAPKPANPQPQPAIQDHALVDVKTRDATPLPHSFTNFAGGVGGYEVSPGGTMILFDAATREDEPHQIYVGNVDGTGVRQVTHDPEGATSGAWSPDGSEIVYASGFIEFLGLGEFDEPPLDATLPILDVSSGESRLLVRGLGGLREHYYDYPTPRFSPDGTTILYTGARKDPGKGPYLATVPAAGGESTIWRRSAAWGSYSPNGSKIAFVDTDGYTIAGDPPIEVQEVWIARADGTDARAFAEEQHLVDPNWSPDGTKISYTWEGFDLRTEIVVRDFATGDAKRTATGDATSWLDDDTLIVEDYQASVFTKEPREGPSGNVDATITLTGSSCKLDGVNEPIGPGRLTLELVNDSHFEALFRVVRLKAGQNLANVRATPYIGRENSSFFGPLQKQTLSSSQRIDSGSWAVVCWKDSEKAPNGFLMRFVGVAGPLVVE